MDSNTIQVSIAIAALIGISAYFSASETAFTSMNRIRLQNKADKGDRAAERALDVSGDYDRLLSSILVGNNIVNILSSSLATILFVSISPTYGTTLATIVMTILVLIFGEITPKKLAKENSEKFVKFSAPILNIIIKILTPFNWFFKQLNKILERFIVSNEDDSISEAELISIVNQAESGGGIDDYEVELIRSAINFNNMEVGSILTPRVDVISADINDTIEKIESLFTSYNYSRIIIYEDSIDDVIGVLHEKDFNRLLRRQQKTNQPANISAIIKEVIFVPPSMKLFQLLQSMQFKQIHMAAVTDEYGGTIGIVTLEDVLEELVGEIWDETDIIREEIKLMDDGSYRILGNTNLDKVFDLFQFQEFNEDDFISNTISGFVTEQLSKIPEEGDFFDYNGVRFTVAQAQDRRVLVVHLERLVDEVTETEKE